MTLSFWYILFAYYTGFCWILGPLFRNEKATYLQAVKALHFFFVLIIMFCGGAAGLFTR